MLFAIPPTRFTPISPYPQYTQQQLDMRRKAEVLSYGASKSNTKTNNYTRSEKYALLVKGINQTSSYTTLVKPVSTINYVTGNTFLGIVDSSFTTFSQQIIKATAKKCPNLDMIPTPTSSSDVPGPLQYLYRDVTIPLYNYATQNRSYSSEPVTTTNMWSTNVDQNVFCNNGISTTIFSVGILDPIDKPSYNFTFTTPVALTYSATVTNSLPIKPVDISNIILSITNAQALVLYSGQQVHYVSPVCTFYNNSIDYDISFSPTSATTTSVSVTSYVGSLTISNLNLFTSPGFVYDIQLNCIINNPMSNNASITNQKYGIICNYQGSNTILNNCIIRSSPVSTLTSYTFNGL
jgi:hypothetical protein